MREIRFRGWDNETKKMWDWYELMNTHPLGCLYTHHDLSWVVMQYTGLKDKNGKEIYEGDIVKRTYNSGTEFIGEVTFDEATYFIRNDEEFAFLANQYDKETLKVIGNIYENPELISE